MNPILISDKFLFRFFQIPFVCVVLFLFCVFFFLAFFYFNVVAVRSIEMHKYLRVRGILLDPCPASSAVNSSLKFGYKLHIRFGSTGRLFLDYNKKVMNFFLPQTGDATNTQVVKHVNFMLSS